jgi:hypothetical protein
MTPLRAPTFPAPSADVRAEALARAQALAEGLFPHQVEGVAFLLGRRRAILADDMGLGKTRQSIIALTEASPAGPWLVVSPASVKQNWAREIAIVRRSDPVHIIGPGEVPEPSYSWWVIINYDILNRHDDLLVKFPWTGFVFDEAHYLKNHTSQRSKISRALVAAAPNAALHALTGTPLTNRPRDLFPLLQLVGHPMGKSFLSFAKRYCAAEHNGFGWVTTGASNLDELRIQLHGVMLRRTKDEVLDLPPKLRRWVPTTVPKGTARSEMRVVLQRLMKGLSGGGAERIELLGLLCAARSPWPRLRRPSSSWRASSRRARRSSSSATSPSRWNGSPPTSASRPSFSRGKLQPASVWGSSIAFRAMMAFACSSPTSSPAASGSI